ncbi:hypothetical protein [Bacteroides pyogenes]|uniref:hypothetical protein n=1 Tax=Bacteroides pyogenes TaxID=310300 RepID=UPI0011E45BD3|nr:hypothetical protein [Bacteroides pyogenes]TYK35949.1 hypothetical protein FNJ61_09015 [Bacteroides pyogenes]
MKKRLPEKVFAFGFKKKRAYLLQRTCLPKREKLFRQERFFLPYNNNCTKVSANPKKYFSDA